MGFSKNLSVILFMCISVQNILIVQANYTIVGLGGKPGVAPSSLVAITHDCVYQEIAAFPSVSEGYSFCTGAVDSNGYYYANFQDSTTDWWLGTTFTIDLNNPSAGWSTFGEMALSALVVNSAGDVVGVGNAAATELVALKVSATEKSLTAFGNFPDNTYAYVRCGTSIDGNGIMWVSGWYQGSPINTTAYNYALNVNSGKITDKVHDVPQDYPEVYGIFWDETKGHFSLCQLSEFEYSMCTIDPNTNDIVPYGPTIVSEFPPEVGGYSPTDRILYTQLNIHPTMLNTNLVGFDIDTGNATYNCIIPTSIGGYLSDVAIWPM